MRYGCPYCMDPFATFAEAKDHAAACPRRETRLHALGSDLEAKVRAGKLNLEAAEAEQAQRTPPAL